VRSGACLVPGEPLYSSEPVKIRANGLDTHDLVERPAGAPVVTFSHTDVLREALDRASPTFVAGVA
jgi:hypothetical protein